MAELSRGKLPTETGSSIRPSGNKYKYVDNVQYTSIHDVGRKVEEDTWNDYVYHNNGSCKVSINSASDLHWTVGWVGRKWKDWNNYYKSATVRRCNASRIQANSKYNFRRYPKRSASPKIIKMIDSNKYGTYGTFSYNLRTIYRQKKDFNDEVTCCYIFKKIMLQDIINNRGKKIQRLDKYYQDTSNWVFRDVETNNQVRAQTMDQERVNGWAHGGQNFYTMGGTAEGNLFHSYRDHLANWEYYGTNYKIKSTVEPNEDLIKQDLVANSFISEEDTISYIDKTAYSFDANYTNYEEDEIFIKLLLTKLCPTYDCENNILRINNTTYNVDTKKFTFTNNLNKEVSYYLIDENDQYIFCNPKMMLKSMFLEDEENKALIKKYAILFQFPYFGGVTAKSYYEIYLQPSLEFSSGVPDNYFINYEFSFPNYLSELVNTDIDTSFNLSHGRFDNMYSSSAVPTKSSITDWIVNYESTYYLFSGKNAFPACIDFDYPTEFDDDEDAETTTIAGYITPSLAKCFMPITPLLSNVSGFSFLSPTVPVYIYLGRYEENNGVISGYPICYLRNLESGKEYYKYRTPINLNKKVSVDISSQLKIMEELKTLTSFYYYTYTHNGITRMWYFDDNSFDNYVTEKEIVFAKTLPYLNYTWQPFQMSTGSSNCWELWIIIPFVIGRAHMCEMSDPPITYYNVYNKYLKSYLNQNLTDIRQFDRVENIDFIDTAAGLDYKNTQKKIMKKYLDEDLWLYTERPFKTRGGKITKKGKTYDTSVENRLTNRPTDEDSSESQLLNKYFSDTDMTRGMYATYLGWGFSWAWFLNEGFRTVSQNIKMGIKYCETLEELYGEFTENYTSITLYNPDRIPNSKKANTFSIKKEYTTVLFYQCDLLDGNLIFYDKKNQCKYYVTVTNINSYSSYNNNGSLYTPISKLIYNYYNNKTTDFASAIASNSPIIFHTTKIDDPDILGKYTYLQSANVTLNTDITSNQYFKQTSGQYTVPKVETLGDSESVNYYAVYYNVNGYFINYNKGSATIYFYYRNDMISEKTASIIISGLTKSQLISLNLSHRDATLEEAKNIINYQDVVLTYMGTTYTSRPGSAFIDCGYSVYPETITCTGKTYESNGDYTTYDLTSSAEKWLTKNLSDSDITEIILYAFSRGSEAIENSITQIYLQDYFSNFIQLDTLSETQINNIYNKYIDNTIYWNITDSTTDDNGFSLSVDNEDLTNNEDLTDDEKEEIKYNQLYLTTSHTISFARQVAGSIYYYTITSAIRFDDYYLFNNQFQSSLLDKYHVLYESKTYYKENYDGINFYANLMVDDDNPIEFKYEIPLSELIAYKTNILDDLDGYIEDKIFTNFLEYYSTLYDILTDEDKAKIDVIKDYIDAVNASREQNEEESEEEQTDNENEEEETPTIELYTNKELIEMINEFNDSLSYEDNVEDEESEENEEEEENEEQSITEIISFANEYITLINRYQEISKYGEYYIKNNFDENYKLVVETAFRLLEYGYDYSFIEKELSYLHMSEEINVEQTAYDTTIVKIQANMIESIINKYFFSGIVFNLNYYDEFVELMSNFDSSFSSKFETFLSTYEAAYGDYGWGDDQTSYSLNSIMELLLTNEKYPESTYGDGTVKNYYYFLPVFDRFFSKCSYYQKKLLYELGYTYEIIYIIPQIEPHWQNRHAVFYASFFFSLIILIITIVIAAIATITGNVEAWLLVVAWIGVMLSTLSLCCMVVIATLDANSKTAKIWNKVAKGIKIAQIVLSIVSLGGGFDSLSSLEATLEIINLCVSIVSLAFDIYIAINTRIENKKTEEVINQLEESEEEYEEQLDYYIDDVGDNIIFYPNMISKTEQLYDSIIDDALMLPYESNDYFFDTDNLLSTENLKYVAGYHPYIIE